MGLRVTDLSLYILVVSGVAVLAAYIYWVFFAPDRDEGPDG
jgi:hypothetical protein